MIQIPEMTHKEKFACYMKSPKKKLAEMLIECNRMLDVKQKESTEGNFTYSTTTFDNSNELTKKEKISSQILAGLLAADTKEDLKFSFEQIFPKLAIMYTDELIKQLNKK